MFSIGLLFIFYQGYGSENNNMDLDPTNPHLDHLHLDPNLNFAIPSGNMLVWNNQLYLVAIMIGDSKNIDSWEWLMKKLYEVIGDFPKLVIISD